MVLPSRQLAASIDVSPPTKTHQSRCVGPSFLSLRRWRVVAPTNHRSRPAMTFSAECRRFAAPECPAARQQRTQQCGLAVTGSWVDIQGKGRSSIERQYPRVDFARVSELCHPGRYSRLCTICNVECARHVCAILWATGGGGGGGGWHNAGLFCLLPLVAPIGLSPLPLALSLNPLAPQAAVPIGLSPPRALPLPLPGLSVPPFTSPPTLPFLW